MSRDKKLLVIQGLKVYYVMSSGSVKAVDKVNLDIRENEVVALVGESGCGKSTLAYSILRIIPYPGRIIDGKIYFDNIDITSLSEEEMRKKIRWRNISMIFQGAMNSLNPVMKIKDQLMEAIFYHEDSIDDIEGAYTRAIELIKRVGLDPNRVLESYPHELSGGMKQRVVIAMSLLLNPKLVIADEPTTALDVTTQANILELLRDIQKEIGISILLITHDLPVVAEIADRVFVMYAGKIVEHADIYSIFREPKHPYTDGLISSVPSLVEGKLKKLKIMKGEPPDLINPPSGCRFHPRCPYKMDICEKEEPPPINIKHSHVVNCWLYVKR